MALDSWLCSLNQKYNDSMIDSRLSRLLTLFESIPPSIQYGCLLGRWVPQFSIVCAQLALLGIFWSIK
jgi:hypothetical protein